MSEKQDEYIEKELKDLIKNYNEELKQLELQAINSLNSLKEKYTSALELLKSKTKDQPSSLNLSLIREKREHIIDVNKIFLKFFEEFDKKEGTKNEMFSEKDSNEVFNFNYLNEFLQNDNDLENHKDFPDLIESSSIKNETILYCSYHRDRKAEWKCRGHCDKKFCMFCFNKFGFSSKHGILIKLEKNEK